MSKFVGLDYDFKDSSFLRSVISEIVLKYNPSELRLFVSPSGRGYHIKFFIDDKYSDGDLLRIRKELGDDENRISMVEGSYRDVLFDAKMIDDEFKKTKELDVDRFLIYGEEVFLDGG
jgi:hypothetical protein